MSPNNRMQRAGHDKLHAPRRHFSMQGSGCAPQAQRIVADAGRWATPERHASIRHIKTTHLIAVPVVLMLGLMGNAELLAAEASDGPAFYRWSLSSVYEVQRYGDTDAYVGNAIRITGGGVNGSTRTLKYMTGGESNIFDADDLASAQAQRAPDDLIEKQQEGEVVVHLWAFNGQDVDRPKEFTSRVANAMNLATTRVFPGRPTSVHVHIYVMPNGAPYSLAREVQWRTGRPLEIAIFVPAGKVDGSRDEATHELFHVLTVLQRTSQWWDRNRQRRNAATALEEVAANLFASCGALLADGYLSRPYVNPDASYVINEVPMRPPLTGEQVKLLLAGLRVIDSKPQAGSPGTAIGHLLESTPVFHVFERAQERIDQSSYQGERLLGMCRDLLPDPMSLEPWLEALR